MGKFIRNILIGIGIGLLIAPMRGEEMRRYLAQNFQELFGSLPTNKQSAPYSQRVSGKVSPMERNLQGIAEDAIHPGVKDSLLTATFTPAYPEYVNPETNPDI
ncbi:MAG: hypothetical protein ABI456_00840 [Ktedonobacteraceae bacterium]